jgi:hypothetical protein
VAAGGIEHTMIWVLVLLNVATTIIALRKRVFPYFILTAVFIVLVVGQAIQMHFAFEDSSTLHYAFSVISWHGFRYALWYVFVVSLLSLLLCSLSRGYRRGSQPQPRWEFNPPASFYVAIVACLCALGGVLIFGVVGLSSFLHTSRPGDVPGATLFITFFGVGTFPLLFKLLFPGRVRRADIFCFLFALALSAGFSRLHVILYVFILLITLFYTRGWSDRAFNARIILIFSAFAVFLFGFFFAVGAIRDAMNVTQGSISDLVEYSLQHPSTSLLSVQVNYRVGIEGMSGLAGAISEAQLYPGEVHRDYGAFSILRGLGQMLPGAVKQDLRDTLNQIETLYWYKKPIGNVSSGLEISFVSFGWIGMILYPCLFFLAYWWVPVRALQLQLAPPLKLACFIWFGCGIFFVRGSWAEWIAFYSAYLIMIGASWIFFSLFFFRVERPEPS